jgi:hypothetical protein
MGFLNMDLISGIIKNMYKLRRKRKAYTDLPDLHANKRIKQSNPNSTLSSGNTDFDFTSSLLAVKKTNHILKPGRYINTLPIPRSNLEYTMREEEYLDPDSDPESLEEQVSQLNNEIDELQIRMKKQSDSIKSLFDMKDQIEREQKCAIREYSTQEALESKIENEALEESNTTYNNTISHPILLRFNEPPASSVLPVWDAISQDLMILSQEYELNLQSLHNSLNFLMNPHSPRGSF